MTTALLLLLGAVAGVAATSLLQPSFDRIVFRIRSGLPGGRTTQRSLNGVWLSRYAYDSSDHRSTLVDEHYLVIKQFRGHLRAHSIDMHERSSLTLSLDVEGSMATGSWRELVSDRQLLYHGACQLSIATAGDRLDGRWTGFSRSEGIRSGEWALRRASDSTSWLTRRRYRTRSDLAWRLELEKAAPFS